MIVDQFGNPIKPRSRPEARTVAAMSLRDRWSMYPSVGLTPVRLTQIFQDADQGALEAQAELFEEMEEKDAHLASILQTRKAAVMGLDWHLEPFSDDPKDQETADWAEVALREVGSLEDALLDLLDAIGKGYSLVEIDWKVQQYAEPVYFRWVHPKRVTFWNRMDPGLIEGYGLEGKPLEPWKFIFHRSKNRSGHDSRAGVLRVVSWMYVLKNYAMKDWATFNEIFGMPMRLGKYDPSASEADKAALVTAIRNLGADAAGIISKSTEIEFVEATLRQTGNSNPYQLMADFCNREMSKAVLGQTLTTDTSGSTGTYAAGSVHNEVRRDLVESDANDLAASLRAQLLRPLVGFNFGWERPVPYWVFDLAEEKDLKSLSEAYQNIQSLGVPLTLEHLGEVFGIPAPEKGQQVVSGPGSAAEMSGQGPVDSEQENKKSEGKGEEAQGSGSAPESESTRARVTLPLRDGALEITEHDRPVLRAQEELDALAEEALQASAAASATLLAPVRELIEAGEDLEILKERLLEVYGDLDTQDLEEALYQAAVLAALRGRMEGDA